LRPKAALYYEKAINEDPESRRVMAVMDKIVGMHMAQSGEGLSGYRRWAQKLKGEKAKVQAEFGITRYFYKQRDYDKALMVLTRFRSKVKDGHWKKQSNLFVGLCHLGKGDRESAVATFRQIALSEEKDELSARAQFLVGWCLMSDQKYEDAADEYGKLIKEFLDSRYVAQAKKLKGRLAHILGR